jgi:pimeloyl-ACP methyl ester carboxylesterase
MSVIVLNSEMVHYEVLGRGRPIIFLHGWIGSWRYWIPTMQACSTSYRTYALDLFGFGDSTKNKYKYGIHDQIGLIDNFMENMGMLRVALVGHGYGSLLAMLYTQEHPELVDRVMAVSFPLEQKMVNNRLRTGTAAELSEWLLGKTMSADLVNSEGPKTDPLAVSSSINEMGGVKIQEIWRNMSTPCVMVHGQNDQAVQPPQFEQLAEMPNQMHSVLFEQSGHFPMLEETNKFNRLLVDFLTLPSGDSPRELQLKEEWKRRVR